jgi:hypothetical protein
MRRKIFVGVIVSLAIFAVSCSSNYIKQMQLSEETFYKGQYKEAAKMLLPQVNSSDKDQLVFMMECGLMLHAAQDYETSNKVLLEAAKLADNIATKVTQQAASLFINDTVTNYKGEDFERVLIHMYLGINFLTLKNADAARVEFKKVNDLLRDINVSGGKAYKQNLMAKYLTAIAFEVIAEKDNDNHDWEFAYVEYKQIQQLDPRLAMVYRDLKRMAQKLKEDDDVKKWARQDRSAPIPADAGEMVMIYQAGKSAIKVSRGSLMSDQAMVNGINVALRGMPAKEGVTTAAVLLALKMAENPIPKFQKRQNKINHLVININGKDIDKTYMLEDIENTAVKNLEEAYTSMVLKVAAGVAVKGAASVAAGYAAKKIAEQTKKAGAFAGLIGLAVGAGTGAALLSQMKPDLRCWHTLPANFQLSRIFLAPGQYNITIKFIDSGNRVERTTNHVINIVKGQKTIFNFRTLY